MLWEVQVKEASWTVRKILQADAWMGATNIPRKMIMDADSYSIKQVYQLSRGSFNRVPWRRLICNNKGSPRWVFILYAALHERLYTRDRLEK